MSMELVMTDFKNIFSFIKVNASYFQQDIALASFLTYMTSHDGLKSVVVVCVEATPLFAVLHF